MMLELNEKLEQKNIELIEARAKAESATIAKGQFLANMSHEIRTPMNAIIGMGYILSKTALDDTQQKHLKKIQAAAEGLLSIINDILDYSKIEAGKMDIEHIPFSLQESIEQVVDIMSIRALEKNIDLNTNIDSDVPIYLKGDCVRLGQILTNLLSNAIKFTKGGEVSLKVSKKDERDGKATLLFSVKDSGIGMTKEQLQRLFKEFSQADESVTRKYGGTGLGLAICKKLTNIMGGDIWVESEPNIGSSFYFELTFDIADSSMLAPKDEYMGAQRVPEGTKILLAEDNEVNQEIAITILSDFGYSVDVANNGQEALELIQNNRYDAVLMDIQMPKMDGLEVTRRVRKMGENDEYYAKLPIIALSANAMSSERDMSIKAGMNEHLSKPFVPQKLNATLISLCNIKPTMEMASTNDSNSNMDFSVLKGIDVTAGLGRIGGKEDIYVRILSSFAKENGDIAKKIDEAISAKDIDYRALLFLSHGIRGAAGNIGAKKIFELATELESAAKQESLPDMTLICELKDEIASLSDSISLFIKNQGESASTPKSSVNRASVSSLLENLILKLDSDLGEAMSVLDELKIELKDSAEWDEYMKIQELVDSFDIDSAKEFIVAYAEKIRSSSDKT